MQHGTVDPIRFPASEPLSPAIADPLSEVLRLGARRLLTEAVEAEVAAWLDERQHLTNACGHRQVVRNGRAAERTVVTGLGPLRVSMPRVLDRRPPQEKERFASAILPPYLRKARSVEELIPWLYLKGVSSGDFGEALAALLGARCPGLSASVVTRLVAQWQQEHRDWSARDLSGKHYVYVWADGVHFNIRLEEPANARQCILVLMGATAEGRKELIAVQDGYRESEQSWTAMLLDLQQRGLTIDPKLACADGALGFWAAMRKVWPATREQRCWVHKTANVLDKLPKSLQPKAKEQLHEVWMAPTRAAAEKAFELFLAIYLAKYPAAANCLQKDREALLTFYDFPAEHWIHLRTTNPIESTFATVRLRHDKTKGNGSRKACLAMVFRLAESAQKRWRRLNRYDLIPDLIVGAVFIDGEKQQAA